MNFMNFFLRKAKILLKIFPNKKNVTPRYDQIALESISKHNKLYQILSPNKEDQGVWIHQEAWFHLGNYNKETEEKYILNNKNNGIYIFVISGKINIDGQILNQRDGMGIWDIDSINFSTNKNSRILLMELPLSI